MKKIFVLIICIIIVSCGNEKVLQLPDVNYSKITDVKDISPAYLFYDETLPDSVELNRKNLIITTNWLVNVDKRLTLKQAIPHIKFLQEKKRNAEMHKNEDAKNYFTCYDTIKKSLSFIEFTDVVYHEEHSGKYFSKIADLKTFESNIITIDFTSQNKVIVSNTKSNTILLQSNGSEFLNTIKQNDSIKSKIYLNLHKDLSFNNYIDIKYKLLNLNLEHIEIAKDEFIY